MIRGFFAYGGENKTKKSDKKRGSGDHDGVKNNRCTVSVENSDAGKQKAEVGAEEYVQSVEKQLGKTTTGIDKAAEAINIIDALPFKLQLEDEPHVTQPKEESPFKIFGDSINGCENQKKTESDGKIDDQTSTDVKEGPKQTVDTDESENELKVKFNDFDNAKLVLFGAQKLAEEESSDEENLDMLKRQEDSDIDDNDYSEASLTEKQYTEFNSELVKDMDQSPSTAQSELPVSENLGDMLQANCQLNEEINISNLSPPLENHTVVHEVTFDIADNFENNIDEFILNSSYESDSKYDDACAESVYESALSMITADSNGSDNESNASTIKASDDDIEWPIHHMDYSENSKLKPNWYYKNGILYTRKEPDLIKIYQNPDDPLNEDFKRVVQFCRSPRPDQTPYSQIHLMDKKTAKWFFKRLQAEDAWFSHYKREQLDEEIQLRLYGTTKKKHTKAQRRATRKELDKVIYPPPKTVLEYAKDGQPVKWIGPGGRNARGEPKKAYIQANFVKSDVQQYPYEYDEKGYRIVYQGSGVAEGFSTKARRLVFINDAHYEKWQADQNRLLSERQAAIDANNMRRSSTITPNRSLNTSVNVTLSQVNSDALLATNLSSTNRTMVNTMQQRPDPKPLLTIAGQLGELELPAHTLNYAKTARKSRYCIWGLQQTELVDFRTHSFAPVSILTINTDLHFVLIPKNYYHKRLQIEDYLTDILPSVAGDRLIKVEPKRICIGEVYIVYLAQGYNRFFRACLERQEALPMKEKVNILLIDFGQNWHADTSQFYRFKDTLNEHHMTPPTVIIAEVRDGDEECQLFTAARFKTLMQTYKNDQHEAVKDLRAVLADRGAWCKPIRPSNDHFRLLCNLKVCPPFDHEPSHAVDVAQWLLKGTPSKLPEKMPEPPEPSRTKLHKQREHYQQQMSGYRPAEIVHATSGFQTMQTQLMPSSDYYQLLPSMQRTYQQHMAAMPQQNPNHNFPVTRTIIPHMPPNDFQGSSVHQQQINVEPQLEFVPQYDRCIPQPQQRHY